MLTIARYRTDPTAVSHLLEEVKQRDEDHWAAHDLTFCAPMDFSMVYAAADGKKRNRLLGAHRHAVNLAIAFLEASMEDEDARTYAHFEHLTARHADPMIHTHVLVGGASAVSLYPLCEEAHDVYKTALAAAVKGVLGRDIDLSSGEAGSA